VLADLVGAGHERGELPARLLVFLDSGVAEAFPGLGGQVADYCGRNDGVLALAAPVVAVQGGEVSKNSWPQVERVWAALNRHGIDRHCYVLAVGGGAVLDLVGFCAATAHRGIRHIRMPTTTLSQGDGGVGVKNGVNFFGKKNWVGTFSVPFAVVNDAAFLARLPPKEQRAGIIEAIKVAMIRDAGLFEAIEADLPALAALEPGLLEQVIRRSAELHVDHIASAGDPFDLGSARPLDFGHWAAHKLEQFSGFRLGHGEAVAIGIALDLAYSVEAGITPAATAERALRVIEGVGFEVYSDLLESEDPEGRKIVLQGLDEFRQHLGGILCVTLVPEIGRKIEVHQIEPGLVVAAIAKLRNRARARAAVPGS
jgi:3-dehydroquinate synthase